MSGTPESKVKAAVTKLLKQYGVYYFYPATHGYGRSGVPDIICCVKGRFVAIECKAGGGKTTALQDKEINSIRASHGVAAVIRETNIGLVEQILKELTHDNKESDK
jgi:Holliday junction resolvase